MRILIVEDEAIVAMMYQSILLQAGHEVVGIATRGVDAVEKILSAQPEIVLLDISLKVDSFDGIEVCRQVQSESATKVIIITAYQDDATLALAKDAGAFEVICKPINEENLLTAIA